MFCFLFFFSKITSIRWLHASGGTAGSHVVIRSDMDYNKLKDTSTLQDAAVLALKFSKNKAMKGKPF